MLGFFAFAFIVLIGEAIGSMRGAAFIVGGVYLIALVVLILLRKRIFLNMFTNLFSGIIEEESPSDSWKTLLLMIFEKTTAFARSTIQTKQTYCPYLHLYA